MTTQNLVPVAVLARVNPNAHNPRYGRDCHAEPTLAGIVMVPPGADEGVIADAAYDQGIVNFPMYLYAGVAK